MKIVLKFLNDTQISTIHQTMMEAFSDYQIDMTYMTFERFINRAIIGRVDFNLSVGAFDGDKLIAFTNIGIDQYKGNKSAYDAGTGVIKNYRGQGIAGKLFDFAIPKLKETGVKKFYLEVLQENKPAIRAYEKAGFKIDREYNCYKISIDKIKISGAPNSKIQLKPILQNELKNYAHFFDFNISWESNITAIEKVKNHILIIGAFIDNTCIGLISYYPTMEWMMLLGVDKAYRGKGIKSILLNALVTEIKEKYNLVKMANLEPEDPLNQFILEKGFELYVKQYEMVSVL